MNDEQKQLESLNKVHDILHKNAAANTKALDMAIPDAKQLCATYQTIRPLLEAALPLINSIPVYGAKIAGSIKFLMQVAGMACAPA